MAKTFLVLLTGCLAATVPQDVALAGLPHAFSYGGKAVWEFATRDKTVADDARRTKIVHEWTSPDGRLLLRSTETAYKKFPVREYLPELVCAGDAPTEIVDGFRSVSLSRARGRCLFARCDGRALLRPVDAVDGG